MPNKNITRKKQNRKIGGEIIGKPGAHGIAYNLNCSSPGESLCSILRPKKIAALHFNCNTSPAQYTTDKKTIQEFIDFLHTQKGRVVKIFKPKSLFSSSAVKEDFMEEYISNKNILRVYDVYAETYTTLRPLTGYMGMDIMGLTVKFVNNSEPPLYVIMGTKCSGLITINLDKFIVDILCSIVILQAVGYEHNDIKLDNVVLCGDKYKLIDWGQATQIGTLPVKMGTLLSTSPMRWYISGQIAYISKNMLAYKAGKVNPAYAKWPRFIETNSRIAAEFDTVIKITSDRAALYKIYLRSFDIFALGMTILYAVFKYNLDYASYKQVVDTFTSIKNPPNILNIFDFVKSNLPTFQTDANSKKLIEDLEAFDTLRYLIH